MTRNTNTQYVEDHATETPYNSDMLSVHYTDLLCKAQRESAQDMGRAVKMGVQRISERWADFRRALAEASQPPAAA